MIKPYSEYSIPASQLNNLQVTYIRKNIVADLESSKQPTQEEMQALIDAIPASVKEKWKKRLLFSIFCGLHETG